MTKLYYDKYWKDQEELSDLPYKWPILKELLPDAALDFLDFGCGKGVITKKVHELRPAYSISGVDISQKALMVAQKKVPSGTFNVITETQKIPFPTNTFDFILASDVLEHIYDTKTAFQELSRVLKPNGSLLISCPYNGKLKLILAILFGFEFYFDPNSPHIRHFSPKTLSTCVKNVGLTVQKIGYYGRFYPLSKGMYLLAYK
ncbi:MAG: class I SAM-dependent methyltransferase [Patescibacteria group bacterium]